MKCAKPRNFATSYFHDHENPKTDPRHRNLFPRHSPGRIHLYHLTAIMEKHNLLIWYTVNSWYKWSYVSIKVLFLSIGKGQIISEAIFLVFNSPKKQTIFFKDFWPGLKNESNLKKMMHIIILIRSTPSPWLTRIWLTQISLTRTFKKFPFLT